jgi:tetratricopeptide (TPR) repeat protein
MRRWLGRLLVSLGALAALGLAFAAAELATRRAHPARCAAFAAETADIARTRSFLLPCYRRGTVGGRPSLIPARDLSGSARPHVIPLRKRAGVLRVAVIGESSGFLLGNELLRQLEGPVCGATHEVLNCAQPASALEHVEQNLDEVLQYEPDVIVLVFGHNLSFRFSTDDRRLLARQWVTRSCVLATMTRQQRPSQMSNEPTERRLAAFERFLQRLVGETRRRGVRLVLNTMAANLWSPPGITSDRYVPGLVEASFLEATQGPRAAARHLQTIPNPTPFERFRAGEALARAGDLGLARRALIEAIDMDASSGRAQSRTNALLRRVAQAPGVVLRDTERELARAVDSGLPGWESFEDHCHLLPTRMHDEARSVTALLRGAAVGSASPVCEHPPWRGEQRLELGDTLAGALRYSAGSRARSSWHAAASLAVEQWFRRDPVVTERAIGAFIAGLRGRVDPGQASRMLFAIAEGCHRAGRVDRALAVNELARLADERDPGPWYQRGLFALRGGDRAASLAALSRALAIAPSDRESRDLFERVSAMAPPTAAE